MNDVKGRKQNIGKIRVQQNNRSSRNKKRQVFAFLNITEG